MDFTTHHPIGERIDQLSGDPKGYDHCYVLNSGGNSSALAVRAIEPTTGRMLSMYTTEPGVQLHGRLRATCAQLREDRSIHDRRVGLERVVERVRGRRHVPNGRSGSGRSRLRRAQNLSQNPSVR